MLKYFSISLLLVLGLQLSAPLFIKCGYVLNKKRIVAKLCKNQNKKGLKCDGKCYLRAQMLKLIKGDEGQADVPMAIESVKPVLSYLNADFVNILVPFKKIDKPKAVYLFNYFFDPTVNLLRPPQV